MLPAREARTQRGGRREAVRMQAGKAASQGNICRMLSIPSPIPIWYLDKLSGQQTASAMGDLNDHRIKKLFFQFSLLLTLLEVLGTGTPVLRGRHREKRKTKRVVFKREDVFLKEFLQCVVHQDVKDVCWRYPKAAPNTQLPPVDRGP